MDNFTILDSVSKLALESERISLQLAHIERTRNDRTQSQDFEISPWYGAYDLLQSIETDNAQQAGQKEQAEKQILLKELPKTDIETNNRIIYSSRRSKHYKVLSPIPRKENKKSSEKVVFHHKQDDLKYEEISQEYPSMLMTPDSMSTDHSSSPTKTKSELGIRRRSHISLTQKVFHMPKLPSFTDLHFYHQKLPAIHASQTQLVKLPENPPKITNLLQILPTDPKIHKSPPNSNLPRTKISLKTPPPEKSKFLTKHNLILNIKTPKTTLKPSLS